MIVATDLRKRFGDVAAVDGVSLRAEDGQVTGLLGPNGAGKTTSMRMLYGLVRPEGGKVEIDGVDPTVDPAGARRRIGVLPDAHGLYERLTAREHVRYFGELHGLSGAPLETRIGELVELLDMASIADRRVKGFSQGERMKVNLARALVHDPRNVMLDEPTNGLDVMSTRAVRGLIHRLRDEGRCVLFSSHVMQEVSALCDTIIIVGKGKVVAQGTADELRAQAGVEDLEDAFVKLAGVEGAGEGLA